MREILGNWDVFLNVLNIETEDGATARTLRRVFFGEPEKGPLPRYDEVMGQLYIQVLRPLCWAGLLQQERGTASYRFEEAVFMKTPLWRSALVLDTDAEVRRRPAIEAPPVPILCAGLRELPQVVDSDCFFGGARVAFSPMRNVPTNPQRGSSPLPPDRMTAAERRAELCGLLAHRAGPVAAARARRGV